MTIEPTVEFTLRALITPGDTLAVASDKYSLGYSNSAVVIPAVANQVATKEITLTAGQELDLSLRTFMLEGGAGELNPDGVALALSKIFALSFELYSSATATASVIVSAANEDGAEQAWAAYPTFRVDLVGVGAVSILATPQTAGYAVVDNAGAEDSVSITASHACVVRVIVIGYQA